MDSNKAIKVEENTENSSVNNLSPHLEISEDLIIKTVPILKNPCSLGYKYGGYYIIDITSSTTLESLDYKIVNYNIAEETREKVKFDLYSASGFTFKEIIELKSILESNEIKVCVEAKNNMDFKDLFFMLSIFNEVRTAQKDITVTMKSSEDIGVREMSSFAESIKSITYYKYEDIYEDYINNKLLDRETIRKYWLFNCSC